MSRTRQHQHVFYGCSHTRIRNTDLRISEAEDTACRVSCSLWNMQRTRAEIIAWDEPNQPTARIMSAEAGNMMTDQMMWLLSHTRSRATRVSSTLVDVCSLPAYVDRLGCRTILSEHQSDAQQVIHAVARTVNSCQPAIWLLRPEFHCSMPM